MTAVYPLDPGDVTPHVLPPQPGETTGAVARILQSLRKHDNHGVDACADAGATGDGVTIDDAAIAVAALAAVGAGVPLILTPGKTFRISSPISLTGVTGLAIEATGANLVLDDAADEDLILLDSCEGVVVYGLTLDGSKDAQTLTGLFDDDYTSPTRGVAMVDCTRCGVVGVTVRDTRFHGVLVAGGSDNFASGLVVTGAGVEGDNCWGTGLKVHNSPRFTGSVIVATDSLNSQVATEGGVDCEKVKLSVIHAEGGVASPISINSTDCELSDFYGKPGDSPQSGVAALTVGHVDSAATVADGIHASNGILEGAPYGISVASCQGGRFTNVTSRSNTKHNLNVFGDEVGNITFTACTFDTTSDATSGADGIGVLLTSSGLTVPGQFDFNGCTFKSSAAANIEVAGVPGVRFNGGACYDGTGVGLVVVDNTSEGRDVLVVGMQFFDTRSGVSRTQTRPMTSGSSSARNILAFGIQSWNHVTSDSPLLAGSTDAFFGMIAGEMRSGGTADVWNDVQTTARFIGSAAANAANPAYAFAGRNNQGLYSAGSSAVGMAVGGVDQQRWQDPADGEVGILVRKNVGGSFTLERVSMGAADSGGSGFKVLRVPN